MIRHLLTIALMMPLFAWGQNEGLYHLAEARKAYTANELDLALAHADSAVSLDNKLPGALKLRGDIKQRQANYHGALVDYTKAERVDDTDARLYVSRSAIYITEGRLKEATRDASKAIKLAPEDPDGYYNRACAHYLGQNNEGALRDLERAVALNDRNGEALFLRGVVKGELYKEEDGLADIDAALALDPNIAGAAMSAAVLLFELERYEEAITRFTALIKADSPDALEAHYYRADCYYNLGNKVRACADWTIVAETGDKDAQFIVGNYCMTDEEKIPKKPVRSRKTVIEF